MIACDDISVGCLGKIFGKLNRSIDLLVVILSVHIAEDEYQVGILFANKACYFAVIFAEIFSVQVGDNRNFNIIADLFGINRLFCKFYGIIVDIPCRSKKR